LDECQAATKRGCAEASEVADGLRKVLDGTTDLFITTYACPYDGRYHWYQVLISPIYRGDARHAMTMHVDVSALQRDPLTKLPNRALFDAQLDFAVTSAGERHGWVGLLLIDMNNLKLINDQFGHAVGDCAIRSIAKCLTHVFDPHGMVARIGGDEFAVVLADQVDDVSTRRLQHEFEGCLVGQSCSENDRAPSISASFGCALWPEDGSSPGALYRMADQRMYANKHKRRIA
jgi:diguanylate cyclase (GGDEF)-like protein